MPPCLFHRTESVRCVVIALCLGVAAVFLVASPGSASSSRWMFDAGGGAAVPFDEDVRDIYGTAGALSFAVGARVGDGDTWIYVESGWSKNKGNVLPPDPTFNAEEADYRIVPLNLGFRANLVSPRHDSPIRVYLGTGIHWMFTRVKDPFFDSSSTPTQGVYVDIRPEFAVNDRLAVWVRERLSVVLDAEYTDQRRGSFNYSGTSLEVGLSYRN